MLHALIGNPFFVQEGLFLSGPKDMGPLAFNLDDIQEPSIWSRIAFEKIMLTPKQQDQLPEIVRKVELDRCGFEDGGETLVKEFGSETTMLLMSDLVILDNNPFGSSI